MGVKDCPQCYFDVELNREPVGRIVFQLFSDVCPKTSKNFLSLCTGEKGTGKTTGKKLCFKGSTFHRVVKNFMIQGGDFTEGNGRGGESIYGGYFEDENFILKHDRAFLLSMANRGKDTNGSQFFITTKSAPHLDGVHVVFGLVISGFEVIKKIEGLKTDSASRPYADVRVIDCGQLITKSANDVLETKRKRTSYSADSSLSSQDTSQSSSPMESDSESDQKQRHRKSSTKSKRSKKRRGISKWGTPNDRAPPTLRRPVDGDMVVAEEKEGEYGEKEQVVKREKPVVRPEEIPPVPENRFLLRRDMPTQEQEPYIMVQEASTLPNDVKPTITKSGRKIKGRGTMRYHTPPGSKSHSASEEERGHSETPPHWKEEMQRTKNYQPPSVEKWRKGEKFNDRSSSRWDDSDSAWSLSTRCSLDDSSERSSQNHRHKKEKKKAKHKKKAKKHKHAKRRKSFKRKPVVSEAEKSLSSGRDSKVSSHPESVSQSPSHFQYTQRCSPRKKRGKRYRSSFCRESHSNSRLSSLSRSISRGKISSFSKSSSRSRSMSRSRAISRSLSRSRSRSRYSSSISPRSPRMAKLANIGKPKPENLVQESVKCGEIKTTFVTSTPTPEITPVIPMSDSPPPSRWKPDQKPWKPSYVRIQEIKAPKMDTTSLAIFEQAANGSTSKEVKPLITQKQYPENSHSERSQKNKRHKCKRWSRSGSSRSSTYSRSYRQSKSRRRSRSRLRSPGHYDILSSSYSRSDSNDSRKRSSYKRKSLDKGWKWYYSALKRIYNLDKHITIPNTPNPISESVDESRRECSPDLRRNTSTGCSPLKPSMDGSHSQEEEAKRIQSLPLAKHNSESEVDGDGDKLGKNNPLPKKLGKADTILDKKLTVHVGWDSESESVKMQNKMVATEHKHVSEKEEGEASSESEKDNVVRLHIKLIKKPEREAETEKYKIRKKAKRKHKHKRRSVTKLSSHRLKEKISKSKFHNLRETFHWQPPLEFGEEEEEDDSQIEKCPNQKLVSVKGDLARDVKGKPGKSPGLEYVCQGNNVSKQPKPSCTEYQQEMTKELNAKQSVQANSKQCACKDISDNKMGICSSHLPKMLDNTESLDDMELCSPEQSTPEPPVLSNKLNENTFTTSSHKRTDDCDTLPQPLLNQQQSLTSGSTDMVASGQHGEIVQGKTTRAVFDLKWKPLKGMAAVQAENPTPVAIKNTRTQENMASQGFRIEIKSKSRVRPGSLFDEVRKTARLNQRPRNQDSSSEERSPSETRNRGGSWSWSTRKSGSVSSQRSFSRGRSKFYSRSRSRSWSSSSSSRSHTSSRKRHSRVRSRSRNSTYGSYRSCSRTYSRSHSRSRSYGRHRRSRSDSNYSYSSRSRSTSRRYRGYRRSTSYRSSDRHSRSSCSSSHSSSRHGRHSHSSRYS
ncbi:NK-tumor recognition protein isoform X1 [Osmerus eperlanus]|uniref:NK-tumor recognition protein isoform X1 n=1 Tax=Osmerus eperlanus TaxID=29151 RepID=UPI002E151331